MLDGYDIVHVIEIAHSALGYNTMLKYYDQSRPLGGAGTILCSSGPLSEFSPICLSVNCQLNAMWAAPSGNLWAVDDLGHVFTTADIDFPASPNSRLSYHNGTTSTEWHVTQAFHAQLNGIWGTADDDVWITSFIGPILHWNGRQWSSFELPEGPNGICGSASDNIYVVGYDGQINHWNGRSWVRILLPKELPANTPLTGVAIAGDTVYITSRSGSLLIGNAARGFQDVGSPRYSWYGVGLLDGRVFLAGGKLGIFEYADNHFVCLKERGQPVGVYVAKGAVHFIPGEQESRPWFVRYKPGDSREWIKVST